MTRKRATNVVPRFTRGNVRAFVTRLSTTLKGFSLLLRRQTYLLTGTVTIDNPHCSGYPTSTSGAFKIFISREGSLLPSLPPIYQGAIKIFHWGQHRIAEGRKREWCSWGGGSNPSPPARGLGSAVSSPAGFGRSINRPRGFHCFQHSGMAFPDTITLFTE